MITTATAGIIMVKYLSEINLLSFPPVNVIKAERIIANEKQIATNKLICLLLLVADNGSAMLRVILLSKLMKPLEMTVDS